MKNSVFTLCAAASVLFSPQETAGYSLLKAKVKNKQAEKRLVLSDNVGLRAPGAPGQQGVGERVEGASGQEHQRGRLQSNPGGAGCRPGPLLPADPRRRA